MIFGLYQQRHALAVLALASCGGAASKPSDLTNHATPTNGIALTILFNDQELWAGNDDIEADANATYPGALHALEKGLDALALPPTSTITVIGYATGARVIVPRKSIKEFASRDLGDQHGYYRRIGTDMVQGVESALAELEPTAAEHKLIVVIGDGNDTNNELATKQLAQDATRAAAAKITVRAVIWKTVVSPEGEVIHNLTSDVKTVNNAAALAQVIPEDAR